MAGDRNSLFLRSRWVPVAHQSKLSQALLILRKGLSEVNHHNGKFKIKTIFDVGTGTENIVCSILPALSLRLAISKKPPNTNLGIALGREKY